ncbi:MAG: MopE-related protein, partial [bacterium]
MDADCSGGSDYDRDGDGFDADTHGGTDCDDSQDTTYPGAEEVWYDGIDGDCAGGSDDDADADGFDAALRGGDDCNDADAEVHPAASDLWYDGVDHDCGGEDDHDADGDGFVPDEHVDILTWQSTDARPGTELGDLLPAGDCIDDPAADPAAPDHHPAAPDAWYDGEDHDCAGNDDYDRDGDGDRSDAHAAQATVQEPGVCQWVEHRFHQHETLCQEIGIRLVWRWFRIIPIVVLCMQIILQVLQ